MKPNPFYLFTLCCIFTLISSCKDDDDSPLRFYNTEYEVPMGGRRYLGLESGNGDYSLEIKDSRIASAGTETGWTGVPAGRQIYVTGILTGKTYLTVTDNATKETCTLTIKVVDNYENIKLLRSYLSTSPNEDANLLPGISDIFLINNHERDVYFFKQGEQTAFSSGLELISQGTYRIEKEEGNDEIAVLTLTFSEDAATQPYDHRFILWGNSYLFHRLDKNLNLNWNTPPIGETRTSPEPPPSYTLEEIEEGIEPGKGRQIKFSLSQMEIPNGILP